jgi:hypothetical protein
MQFDFFVIGGGSAAIRSKSGTLSFRGEFTDAPTFHGSNIRPSHVSLGLVAGIQGVNFEDCLWGRLSFVRLDDLCFELGNPVINLGV